mgnify:CR=1 FL=1
MKNINLNTVEDKVGNIIKSLIGFKRKISGNLYNDSHTCKESVTKPITGYKLTVTAKLIRTAAANPK